MTEPDEMLNVRYIVDDVDAALEFCTKHLGFEIRTSPARLSARALGPATRGVA